MLLVKPSIGRMIAAVDADETTAAKSVPNSSLEARRSWRDDQSNMTISNRCLEMEFHQGPSHRSRPDCLFKLAEKGIVRLAKRVNMYVYICTCSHSKQVHVSAQANEHFNTF
jgi:hypothetical protein